MSIVSELDSIKSDLKLSSNEWRWNVTLLITGIPSGYLASYGILAHIYQHQYNRPISARNIAWLREYLYRKLGHDTEIPLHRIAKQNDIYSHFDSEETQIENNKRRTEEGTLGNPKWVTNISDLKISKSCR